ncbi:MAG: hypothetical protein V3U71_03455 [Cocleimonas sp.]
MSDSKNPYTAPESNVNNNLQTRSSIPKVIGIISIILGALGLITGLFTFAGTFMASGALESLQESGAAIPGLDKNYLMISGVITLVTSIWAIFIGFKLLKYLDLGRRHFNYYTIVTIIISIVTFFYTKDMMDKMFADMPSDVANAAGGMATLGSMGAFIAPIILIIVALLLNQKNVKDSLI